MLEEPVEILVGMAESGEIDPWNIDIVEVTDRFLSELERLKELDLRISGRTLFYAATLLRMKSEYLEEMEDGEEEVPLEDPDDFDNEFESTFDFDGDVFREPIDRLEREIKRRIGRKKQRKRPVTLYELIKELKTAEKEERRRHRRRRIAPEPEIDADEVVSIAHEEGYQSLVSTVLTSFERAAAVDDRVSIDQLCTEMGCGLRDVYIPLLFLMIEGKLILYQDDFFGDIIISRWHPDAFPSE
jgi:segregation and condensation protein A